MTKGDRWARFSRSESAVARRETTVGDICDWLAETDGELAVTPWRRGQRQKLQAVVEAPWFW